MGRSEGMGQQVPVEGFVELYATPIEVGKEW
jgi:hypothetical protein